MGHYNYEIILTTPDGETHTMTGAIESQSMVRAFYTAVLTVQDELLTGVNPKSFHIKRITMGAIDHVN